jgi:hypothetical protein
VARLGRFELALCAGALAVLGCRRETPSPAVERGADPVAAPRASAPARPAPGPQALREALGIPADAGYEQVAVSPAAPRPRFKMHGALGEWLEGDVYRFKAESVRVCGEGGPASGQALVIGAEVEIRAKSKLTFSPREVRLTNGGITYPANLDFGRRLKGCSPLLEIAWLKKDEVLRGFVLFDVPPPGPKQLDLWYQPTRWGGAGHVRVTLPLGLGS